MTQRNAKYTEEQMFYVILFILICGICVGALTVLAVEKLKPKPILVQPVPTPTPALGVEPPTCVVEMHKRHEIHVWKGRLTHVKS